MVHETTESSYFSSLYFTLTGEARITGLCHTRDVSSGTVANLANLHSEAFRVYHTDSNIFPVSFIQNGIHVSKIKRRNSFYNLSMNLSFYVTLSDFSGPPN